jgi:hypothetical protein
MKRFLQAHLGTHGTLPKFDTKMSYMLSMAKMTTFNLPEATLTRTNKSTHALGFKF